MLSTDIEIYKSHLKDYVESFQELKSGMNLAENKKRIEELNKELSNPDLWSGKSSNAAALQKELKHLKNKINSVEIISEGIENLETALMLLEEEFDEDLAVEFENSYSEFEKKFEAFRLSALFTGEHDDADAIVTLHSGAGGTEAQDWTEMLYRMYSRWAEEHDMEIAVIEYLPGEEAGIKRITFEVRGDNAYGFLRSEHGVHRLVRISPFDSSGRRHTSFASVEVIPDIADEIELNIKSDDLRIDTYRASGAGGQHVNKTSSAVRITHIPTGVVVACQNERSQMMNKDTAMKMLKAKLYNIAKENQDSKIAEIKGDTGANAWSSQIRSYVFCPYTLVKDHRSGHEAGDVNKVMDGDIDGFINAYLLSNK